MKKQNILKSLIYIFLAAGMIFTFHSCEETYETPDSEATGEIPYFNANVEGKKVGLSFRNVITDDNHPNYDTYEIYRADNGDQFKLVKGELKTTSWVDTSCDYNSAYQYFVYYEDIVNYEYFYSETLHVETASPYTPNIEDLHAGSEGSGESAVLKYIDIEWSVDDADGIDGFTIYRDDVAVGEVDGSAVEYRDEDAGLAYGQTYEYQVVAEAGGETFESDKDDITPDRPDQALPDKPYIYDITINLSNELEFHVRDITEEAEEIEYEVKITDTDDFWSGQEYTSSLETDNMGYFILQEKNVTYADVDSGDQYYIEVRARIKVGEFWSNWSSWEKEYISFNK